MTSPFIGQIMLMANSFAPRGWLACNGSLLAINQYQALFALIGTTYGGNGTSNFAVPDLRSRVPICAGTGSGLNTYTLGQSGGAQSVTLAATNIAPHTHPSVLQVTGAGGRAPPTPENPTAGDYVYTQSAPPNPTPPLAALVGVNVQPNSGGTPFAILPPFLALNYYIALQGIFPSRN